MNTLVIYKKSTYEVYATSDEEERKAYFKQHEQALRDEHDEHYQSLERILKTLNKLGTPHESIWRGDVKGEIENDLLITVGGDGTFLDAAKHVHQPRTEVLGVNSVPSTSTGYFSCTDSKGFAGLMIEFKAAKRNRLYRLEMAIDGIPLQDIALNDVLVAHTNPAATTRYELEIDGKKELHKNSGLLACTAAGSTAWMYQHGGALMPLDSEQLQYVTRDKRSALPRFADELKLYSLTQKSALYIDGEHNVKHIGLGKELILRTGNPLTVIGDLETKRSKYTTRI